MNMPTTRSSLLKILAVFLGLSVFQLSNAIAGTINIFDTSDVITESDDLGGRLQNFSCIQESCTFDVLAPAGVLVGPSTSSLILDVFGVFVEPGSNLISDMIQGAILANDRISLSFISDNDVPGSLGTCSTICIKENGSLQPLARITWNSFPSIEIDTIQVQSDVIETIPEPATILLMLAGLATLAGIQGRRARAALSRISVATIEAHHITLKGFFCGILVAFRYRYPSIAHKLRQTDEHHVPLNNMRLEKHSMSRKHFFLPLLLSGSLLSLAPAECSAGLLLFSQVPGLQVAGMLSMVLVPFIKNKNKRNWVAFIDPLNVESFQLDLAYDPNRMQYLGVNYVDPYVELGSGGPDLSIPGGDCVSPGLSVR